VQRGRATPALLFASLGSAFGLLFLVAIPPFQAPDERVHFQTAWAMTAGQLVPTERRDTRPTARVPRGVVELGKPWERLAFAANAYVPRGQLRESLAVRADARESVEAVVTGYMPAQYLAGATGIGLARLVTDRPLVHYYAGRVATTAFWITGVALAIRLVAGVGWLLFAVALLPAPTTLAASLSPDPVVTASAFLLFACGWRFAEAGGSLAERWLPSAALLTLALAASKSVYAPFGLWPAAALAQARDARARMRLLGVVALLTAAGAAAAWAWLAAVPPGVLPQKTDVDPRAQLARVLGDPFGFVAAVARTLAMFGSELHDTWIGTIGPRLQTYPRSVSWTFDALCVGALACGADARVPLAYRLAGAVAFAGALLATFLAMHLYWTPVGDTVVVGVQGRYFLPVAPLAFVALALPPARLGAPLRERRAWWLGGLAALGLLLTYQEILDVFRFSSPA
jgi:uncharacterized membrane protein